MNKKINMKNTNKTSKLNKVERYFGEIQKLPNGTFRVAWVDKKTKVNQHLTKWMRFSARSFARDLNKSSIVIK